MIKQQQSLISFFLVHTDTDFNVYQVFEESAAEQPLATPALNYVSTYGRNV